MFQYYPSSTPRSFKWSLSFRFPRQNPVCTSNLLPPTRATCPRPSHSSWFDRLDNIWWEANGYLRWWFSWSPGLPDEWRGNYTVLGHDSFHPHSYEFIFRQHIPLHCTVRLERRCVAVCKLPVSALDSYIARCGTRHAVTLSCWNLCVEETVRKLSQDIYSRVSRCFISLEIRHAWLPEVLQYVWKWPPSGWTVREWDPGGGRDFSHPYTTALRPTQLPTQWVPSHSWVESGRSVALTTHPQTNAEVKERVELYIYSPSGPSWLFPWWTLLCILHAEKWGC